MRKRERQVMSVIPSTPCSDSSVFNVPWIFWFFFSPSLTDKINNHQSNSDKQIGRLKERLDASYDFIIQGKKKTC